MYNSVSVWYADVFRLEFPVAFIVVSGEKPTNAVFAVSQPLYWGGHTAGIACCERLRVKSCINHAV